MFPKPKHYCRCGCGTEIKATRKWVSGHNLKRRPKDAIVRNGRLFVELKCSECGAKIERRSDGIRESNYCESCLSVVRSRNSKGRILHKARKGEYRKCRNCHEEYYINPYRVNYTTSNYCSNDCRFDYQRKKGILPKGFVSSADNNGKKNGRYKHGKRVGAHIQKKALREMVIERDGGNWCILCGKPGPGLHLHRILYGSQGGKYELDNCVQLCAKDHEKVHSSKKKWMPYLLKHVEEMNKKMEEK